MSRIFTFAATAVNDWIFILYSLCLSVRLSFTDVDGGTPSLALLVYKEKRVSPLTSQAFLEGQFSIVMSPNVRFFS